MSSRSTATLICIIVFTLNVGGCVQESERFGISAKNAQRDCAQAVAEPSLLGCLRVTVPAVFENDPFGHFNKYASAYYGNRNYMAALLDNMVVPDGGLPVIVNLHGCSGRHNETLASKLAREGFAVFSPNSFYGGRSQECYDQSPTLIQRLIQQVKTVYRAVCPLEWTDCSRSALIGFSEGGGIVALFSDEIGFSAFVIGGATCGGPGIRIPSSRPVLSILGQNDKVYSKRGIQTYCKQLVGRRSNGQHIDVPFMGHTSGDPFAKAMLPFLKEHLKPASPDSLS